MHFFVITFYNIPPLSSSCRQLDAISPCFPLHPQHRRGDERGRTKEQLSCSLRLHPADVRAPMWRQIIAVSKSAVARYRQNMWALVSVCVCVSGVYYTEWDCELIYSILVTFVLEPCVLEQNWIISNATKIHTVQHWHKRLALGNNKTKT